MTTQEGQNCIIRTLHETLLEDDAVGGACSTGRREMHTKYLEVATRKTYAQVDDVKMGLRERGWENVR